jgi:hypothetical protein
MKLRMLILIVQAYRLIPPPVRWLYCRAVRKTKPASAEALRLLKLGEVSAFRAGISDWDHGGMP